MKPRQVYFLTKTEAEANMCITALPLAVNCTGLEYYYAPFHHRAFRHDYGLVYILAGEMDFTLEHKVLTLLPGHFMIIPPGHAISFGTEKDHLTYYWLQFSGSMAEQLLECMSATVGTPYEIGMCEDVCHAFDNIFKEFLINDKFFASISAAKLTDLFVCLFRRLPLCKKELLQSISYIHQHYNEPLCVQALAKSEHTSASHYRKKFNQMVGCSPKEYISLQRINAACFYLTSTDHSVGRIAEMVGYDDQLYFSRFFKQKTGLSPVAYRKKHGER